MRALRQSPWFLVLLCVLLIGARISGAHWHLCFDDAEPPLAVHVGDNDLHHVDDITSSTQHQDIDLKLVADGLIKNLGADLSVPMLLAFIVCLWLLPLRTRPQFNTHYRIPVFLNDPRSLHAPPRAPPL